MATPGPSALADGVVRLSRRLAVSRRVAAVDERRLGLRPETLDALGSIGLLEADALGWHILETGIISGGRVEWSEFARRTIESGLYESQFRIVADFAPEMREDKARRLAPAAAEVISWNPAWRDGDLLLVPAAEIEAALAATALNIPPSRPAWVDDREEVGRRAEAYTLRLERQRSGVRNVIHIARESGDLAGFDVEVRGEPRRAIEAKGSRSERLFAVITKNELRAARRWGPQFEIHFWGGINLDLEPAVEFEALRKSGWPQVIPDPADLLERGILEAIPTAWELRWHDVSSEETK